jgi:uncharacterized protein YhhL (DUF1145 family)
MLAVILGFYWLIFMFLINDPWPHPLRQFLTLILFWLLVRQNILYILNGMLFKTEDSCSRHILFKVRNGQSVCQCIPLILCGNLFIILLSQVVFYLDGLIFYVVCEAIGIGTAATPGLLCQPRLIVKMIVKKQMECRLAEETEVLWENLPQRHFCPSQNPTWPDPDLNPGHLGGKPATRWPHLMLQLCIICSVGSHMILLMY